MQLKRICCCLGFEAFILVKHIYIYIFQRIKFNDNGHQRTILVLTETCKCAVYTNAEPTLPIQGNQTGNKDQGLKGCICLDSRPSAMETPHEATELDAVMYILLELGCPQVPWLNKNVYIYKRKKKASR